MSRERMGGNWRQIKGKARARWRLLTDEDLERVAGRREELIRKVQEKYNKPLSEIERDVDDWYKTV